MANAKEEVFESTEALRKFSEELKADQQRWRQYRLEANRDIEEARKTLATLREAVNQYKTVIDAFMKEVETIKEFKQLVDLNKQLVEMIQK